MQILFAVRFCSEQFFSMTCAGDGGQLFARIGGGDDQERPGQRPGQGKDVRGLRCGLRGFKNHQCIGNHETA